VRIEASLHGNVHDFEAAIEEGSTKCASARRCSDRDEKREGRIPVSASPGQIGCGRLLAALLEAMRRTGRIEAGAAEADVFLYHLGNNQLHREIYRRALEKPGVAVLHDAVLNHFFLACWTRTVTPPIRLQLWPLERGSGAFPLRNRARSAAGPRYFEYPMLRRIAETSRAVVVHNPPRPRWFARTPVGAGCGNTASLRRRAGAPASRIARFGVFGHLRESKRLFQVLKRFARSKEPPCHRRQSNSPEFDRALERSRRSRASSGAVSLRSLSSRVCWPPSTWASTALPGGGRDIRIAIRMMGLGKPVIVTRGEETSRFPRRRASCGHRAGGVEMLSR